MYCDANTRSSQTSCAVSTRGILRIDNADEADLRRPISVFAAMLADQREGRSTSTGFAQVWHMLMKGSIVSACEGNEKSAREAKRAANLVIDGWPGKSRGKPGHASGRSAR